MTARIGRWGRMVEVVVAAPFPVDYADAAEVTTSITGRQYSSTPPISRRRWTWDIEGISDADAAKIEQLLHDQRRGRLWWYEPTAARSNMLPPEVAEPVPLLAGAVETVLPASVSLPGAAGSYVSAPDSAGLSVTGDLDVRWVGTPDVWGAAEAVASKYAFSNRSWLITKSLSGELTLFLSADGSATTSTVSSGYAGSSGKVGVRVTWRASDGRVQWFTMDDADSPDTTAYTQVGADGTVAVASIFDGTAAVEIGAYNAGGSQPYAGAVEWLEVRDGIDGTVVGQADFRGSDAGDRTMTDPQGNVWTLQGDAAVDDPAQATIDGRVWDTVDGTVTAEVPTVDGVGYTAEVRAAASTTLTVERLTVGQQVIDVAATTTGTGLVAVSWTAGSEAGVRVTVNGQGWSGAQMFETALDPGGWMPGRGVPKVLLSGMGHLLLKAPLSGDVTWRETSLTLTEVDA